ncbi:Rhodopsin domain-containing protein [Madurella fahalii]|uniref:Rhodopsin domain-containing protein n=1 Tax=Madurella fahalii TaxID=1157608 RepID=A0ABQ0G1R3_9PEZI
MFLPPKPEYAFAVEPAGPVPYSGFQVFGIFLLAFFPFLALVACGLRVYSRRLSNGLGLDDWLIFTAMALSIPQAVFATLYLRAGYWGIHDADVPPHPINQGLFWSFLNRVFYSPLLAMVKISALLFLLRLGGTKTAVRLACRALIALCLMQLLAFLPTTIFMCDPVQSVWFASPRGRCLQGGPYTVTLAASNILTDILTLLVPFVAFLNLKLNNRIRFALVSVFTLGALVTLVSGLRLYFVIRAWYLVSDEDEDSHYSLGYTTNTIEVNLAIVTATTPALWPLARHWFPSLFDSMGIDRPYMYPDIEVGYVSPPPRAGDQTAMAEGAGQTTPTFSARIRWLQQPRPPSYVRPATNEEPFGETSGSQNSGRTDIGGQRVFEAAATQREHSLDKDADEDMLDYHGVIRQAETAVEHDDSGLLIMHERPESETATPSSGARRS